MVGIPKTIDNDIYGCDVSLGFDTAVTTATEALDKITTTAEAHHRLMVVEVMGRYAGWIALHSGLSSSVDVILIPEIPFSYDSIVEKIKEREEKGRHYTMIVVAEGAKEEEGEMVTRQGSRAGSAPGRHCRAGSRRVKRTYRQGIPFGCARSPAAGRNAFNL